MEMRVAGQQEIRCYHQHAFLAPAQPACATASLRPELARLATHRTLQHRTGLLDQTARARTNTRRHMKQQQGQSSDFNRNPTQGCKMVSARLGVRSDVAPALYDTRSQAGARFQKKRCGAGRVRHASPPIVSDRGTARPALKATLRRRNAVPTGRSKQRRTASRL